MFVGCCFSWLLGVGLCLLSVVGCGFGWCLVWCDVFAYVCLLGAIGWVCLVHGCVLRFGLVGLMFGFSGNSVVYVIFSYRFYIGLLGLHLGVLCFVVVCVWFCV